MSVKLKALQAVAGTTAANAGGATNVEDVFSTYLYTGTSGPIQVENNINLGDNLAGSYTHFDGEGGGIGGYLYRNSDLTSNSDGKTFTASGWMRSDVSENFRAYQINASQDSDDRFYIMFSGTLFKVAARNSSGVNIFDTNWQTIALHTWYHFLISIDLTNTSNRYLYLNDNEILGPAGSWGGYVNDNIDFTNGHHYVQAYRSSSNNGVQGKGGLKDLYLDYTYRDLSVTNNRRLFINSDLTPAGDLSSLNPILYLPLNDSNSIGSNLGTGGDFTVYNESYIDPRSKGGPGIDSGGGSGGLVITKRRNVAYNWGFFDTERGPTKALHINDQDAEETLNNNGITSFNSNGWTGGDQAILNSYTATDGIASWTFRKAPKFFDVVTYTGDTNSSQSIAHNLDSEPGMVIIKSTNTAGTSWWTWHRGLGANTASSGKQFALDATSPVRNTGTIYTGSAFNWTATSGAYEQGSYLQGTSSTDITVGYEANQNGWEYVAYIFGHNDGDGVFGPDEDQDIIYCGTYTGGNGSRVDVELGWEPQWIIAKNIDSAGFSAIADNMRGIETVASGNNTRELRTTATNTESYNEGVILRPTGFTLFSNQNQWNSNANYVYMAIRRGPMATPTNANEVFAIDNEDAGSSSNPPLYVSKFPVDFALRKQDNNTANWAAASRLTGINYMSTNLAGAESTVASYEFDYMNGWSSDAGWNAAIWSWMWRRAPGFFDVVTYTGDGVQGRDISHNLKVAPEMMWVKRRDANGDWVVYHSGVGNTASLRLDDTRDTTGAVTSSWWNNTSPTDSVFTVGSASDVNTSTGLFVAYLFASLDGISKVGSFSHTNNTTTSVDCGFSSGARFVMIKLSDGTDSWYIWDTTRGINAGTEPLLRLNTSGAKITTNDWIDPLSSGFQITGPDLLTGTYIFYAIA